MRFVSAANIVDHFEYQNELVARSDNLCEKDKERDKSVKECATGYAVSHPLQFFGPCDY